MIRDIVDLLNSNDFYDVEDKDIQFAKGSHNLPTNFKRLRDFIKRRKALNNGR